MNTGGNRKPPRSTLFLLLKTNHEEMFQSTFPRSDTKDGIGNTKCLGANIAQNSYHKKWGELGIPLSQRGENREKPSTCFR